MAGSDQDGRLGVMDDDFDRSELPDRWDGKDFAFGKRVMPELGPKVGVHWGHLLMLEKYLRDIQDGLVDVIKADAVDHPFDPGDFTQVYFDASTTLDDARWLEAQVRGLRTGVFPEDLDRKSQSPPESLLRFFPFLRDDDDDGEVPF
jgi:hypothetical protein